MSSVGHDDILCVVCPYCGYIDIEKSFWVAEMPFNKYTIDCEKCEGRFVCKTNAGLLTATFKINKQ